MQLNRTSSLVNRIFGACFELENVPTIRHEFIEARLDAVFEKDREKFLLLVDPPSETAVATYLIASLAFKRTGKGRLLIVHLEGNPRKTENLLKRANLDFIRKQGLPFKAIMLKDILASGRF